MAWTSTYVCDYKRGSEPCDRLAVATCAFCQRFGCADHLNNVVRMLVTLGKPSDEVLPPLPPPAPGQDLPLSYVLVDTVKLNRTRGEIKGAGLETRVCESCSHCISANTADAAIHLKAIVETSRAALAAKALKETA